MSILILAGEGMLGHKVYQTLAHNGLDVAVTLRGTVEDAAARFPLLARGDALPNLDLMDFDAVADHCRGGRPDVIINCSGIIKQRATSSDAIQSLTLNALLPHRLARLSAEWGGRLIHFSTDCVFSGRDGRYTEDSISDAQDLYGRSKFLGEVAEDNALTLRTSIIGRELKTFASLLEWFLSNRGGQIKGFQKVIYAGVTTNYIAGLLVDMIRRDPPLHGLYQLAAPPISKFDLLVRINDAYKTGITIDPEDRTISDRSMIADRFFQETGWPRPDWDGLISQMAADPTPYEEWR